MTGPGPDHELEELVAGAEAHEPGSVDWEKPVVPTTGSADPPGDGEPVAQAEPWPLGELGPQ